MAPRGRASKDRSIARALSRTGLLALAAVGLRCSTPPPLGSGGIAIVAGIGELCAPELNGINLQATTGSRVDLAKTFPVGSVQDLPVESSVAYPGEPGAVHTATATFILTIGEPSKAAMQQLSLSFPDGTTGRVVLSLPCACIGVSCPSGQNCEELPIGSGKTVCQNPGVCGDGVCQPGESCGLCPSDCSCGCGDGICEPGESCNTCPIDCGACSVISGSGSGSGSGSSGSGPGSGSGPSGSGPSGSGPSGSGPSGSGPGSGPGGGLGVGGGSGASGFGGAGASGIGGAGASGIGGAGASGIGGAGASGIGGAGIGGAGVGVGGAGVGVGVGGGSSAAGCCGGCPGCGCHPTKKSFGSYLRDLVRGWFH